MRPSCTDHTPLAPLLDTRKLSITIPSEPSPSPLSANAFNSFRLPLSAPPLPQRPQKQPLRYQPLQPKTTSPYLVTRKNHAADIFGAVLLPQPSISFSFILNFPTSISSGHQVALTSAEMRRPTPLPAIMRARPYLTASLLTQIPSHHPNFLTHSRLSRRSMPSLRPWFTLLIPPFPPPLCSVANRTLVNLPAFPVLSFHSFLPPFTVATFGTKPLPSEVYKRARTSPVPSLTIWTLPNTT